MPSRSRSLPSVNLALDVAADRERAHLCGPRRHSAGIRALGAAALLLTAAASGCSPYPDDGEFLAGIVYAANFVSGVKQLEVMPAVGRGQGVGAFAPYTVVATTQGAMSATTVSASVMAASPFWTDGKRKPLDVTSAQQAFVFDGKCAAPADYRYDERLDLIHQDLQYPLFADIPEILSTNAGKAGRTAGYSAVIEIIHLSFDPGLPCQSIKRFATAQARIGKDLTEVRREYRLLQIIDPAIALQPLPYQLGFYNQLVVPYLDLGPVPVSSDGKTFLTMPLFKAYDKAYDKAADKKGHFQYVVPGTALEPPQPGGPTAVYSPICQDYTLTMLDSLPPPDAKDPAYQTAKKTEALSSCLVCKTLDTAGHLSCPFAQSQVAP